MLYESKHIREHEWPADDPAILRREQIPNENGPLLSHPFKTFLGAFVGSEEEPKNAKQK